MLLDRLPHTVVVLRPATTHDKYGNPELSWAGNAVHHTTTTGWLQRPATRVTNDETRSAVTDSLTLFVPAGTDVDIRDRVKVNDHTYRIDGLYEVTRPDGVVSHIQLTVRRAEG